MSVSVQANASVWCEIDESASLEPERCVLYVVVTRRTHMKIRGVERGTIEKTLSGKKLWIPRSGV